MKNILATALITLLLMSGSSYRASADLPGFLKRLQMGYSLITASTADYEGRDYIPFMGIDTSYTHGVASKGGFGYTIGTSFPLAKLGQQSMMTLGVDYLYNAILWETALPRYGNLGVPTMAFSGTTLQMALPIGLDFKFGGEAYAIKNKRFSATIGAGAYPSYAITSLDYDVDIDPQFSIAPYVKAEIGIFAGICMKLRVVSAFGSFNYMDMTSGDPAIAQTNTVLTGSNTTTISLLVMPFSWTWKRYEWWNAF